MLTSLRRLTFAASLIGAAGAAALAGAPAAHAASDQQSLIDRARITIDDMKKDAAFGNSKELITRARAIMIVPRLYKAGFFFGGEGGDALLLTRGPAGWSAPAFYTLGSASFGLQIGAQQSEMVLFIMSEKALDAVLRNEFKIGANAGIAIATIGSSAEAATTTNLNADIVTWASSAGAYAGISLNGSVLKPRDSYSRAYYGHAVTARDIVMKRSVTNPGASSLQQALGSAS